MNAVHKYDIIEARQDDIYQDDNLMEKSLVALNVFDLGSVDHNVWLKKNKKFGFDLQIENEEDNVSFKEEGVHPYAIESLASFCRRFLHGYSNLMDKELS